jgi:small-conductance mechanosensitive channel
MNQGVIQTGGELLITSFAVLWQGVVAFIPQLVVALIIVIFGWVIAIALGRLVMQIVRALKVDMALESLGAKEVVGRAGFKLDTGAFFGGLVRWFFIIVFLMAAVDVLGLSEVTAFLRDIVLLYIPNVIVAAVILVAAAVMADVAQRVVRGSAQAAHLPSSAFLGGVTKWAIWIFAILAALYQLGVAGPFVQTLFTGFVALVSIAGGLAFGLGGKDAAARFIERLRSDINK